jgi:nicotinate-nucleotide adenylyltransferase
VKLGILGGTFDPPHLAHLALAEEARSLLGLDRVLFVPAGDPWRKAGQEITPAEHRLAMVHLAVADKPHFEVCTLEIEREGPSYTVDTLAELADQYGPEAELYLILGEDALHDMPNWKEPERIVALARLVVARRPSLPEPPVPPESAIHGLAERLIPLDMPPIDISATALRERARQGLSLRGLVPAGVAEYIEQHGLYRERG